MTDHERYSINLSHSGDWGLIATGWVPHPGVDVERHVEGVDVPALAPSVFSDWEWNQLQKCPLAQQRALFF